MSAARRAKGPSTKDKVVSSALAVGAMAGIAGLLAFQTAQVASASPATGNSGAAVTASGATDVQASNAQQVSAYKTQLASVSTKKGHGGWNTSRNSTSKPSVSAPQRTNNAPQATTKGS